MNVAIARKRGKARKVIADVEEIGRRRPLATAAGSFAAGAAGTLLLRSRRPHGGDGPAPDGRAPAGGTRASSYGRDNPSGPGYNWPPEPVPVG